MGNIYEDAKWRTDQPGKVSLYSDTQICVCATEAQGLSAMDSCAKTAAEAGLLRALARITVESLRLWAKPNVAFGASLPGHIQMPCRNGGRFGNPYRQFRCAATRSDGGRAIAEVA